MAIPPSEGVSCWCILRSSGISNNLLALATFNIGGMANRTVTKLNVAAIMFKRSVFKTMFQKFDEVDFCRKDIRTLY